MHRFIEISVLFLTAISMIIGLVLLFGVMVGSVLSLSVVPLLALVPHLVDHLEWRRGTISSTTDQQEV